MQFMHREFQTSDNFHTNCAIVVCSDRMAGLSGNVGGKKTVWVRKKQPFNTTMLLCTEYQHCTVRAIQVLQQITLAHACAHAKCLTTHFVQILQEV